MAPGGQLDQLRRFHSAVLRRLLGHAGLDRRLGRQPLLLGYSPELTQAAYPVGWSALFGVWVLLDLPLGPGAGLAVSVDAAPAAD